MTSRAVPASTASASPPAPLCKGTASIVASIGKLLKWLAGKAGLTRFLWRYTLVIGGAMVLVILVLAAVPEFWLSLAYGDQFTEQAYLLQWWALIYFLYFLKTPMQIGLRAMEHMRPIFWQTAVLAVISVAVCYPLIDRFGILGVMFGMSMVEVMRVMILSFFFNQRLRAEG